MLKQTIPAAICVVVPMLGMSADFYVDGLLGHDSYAGTSVRPKKTIQAAINVAASGDRIYVSPGTYSPFNMDRRLTLIGTKGAWRTIIDGGNMYRCAKFADIEGHELHGFASQNGRACKVGDGQPWTPTVTVKGGTSGFYTIKVGK